MFTTSKVAFKTLIMQKMFGSLIALKNSKLKMLLELESKICTLSTQLILQQTQGMPVY